jgi:adenylosuccinate synthase
MTTVQIVTGGQFGSEAKGHVCEVLANMDEDGRTLNIRVGGPNAGHTVYDAAGNKFAFRHLPVAAVLNSSMLYIAPGSEVDLQVLYDEMTAVMLAGHDLSGRVHVSPQATILTERHKEREAQAELRKRVGSTAKGIGAARAERLWRTADLASTARYRGDLQRAGVIVSDDVVDLALRQNRDVLIEGTQGYGLGLHAGFYPFCTATDCRAVDFYAQSGLPLGLRTEVYPVFRTYPIRVAGNSGPLHGELTWEDMARKVPGLEPEMTTVTGLIRRIGSWDHQLAADALRANGYGRRVEVRPVLSFVDYLQPSFEGGRASEHLRSWLYRVQDELTADLGSPFQFALYTTGPRTHMWAPEMHGYLL